MMLTTVYYRKRTSQPPECDTRDGSMAGLMWDCAGAQGVADDSARPREVLMRSRSQGVPCKGGSTSGPAVTNLYNQRYDWRQTSSGSVTVA